MESVANERRVREIERRAYIEGADSGLIEVRGYGLTDYERAQVEAEAAALYPEPVEVEAVAS